MAGYVRQSAADIVPTAVVRAAPINNELNALRDAFAQATQVRAERNSLLTATDWRFRSDMNPSQEWKDYCQALRDITEQAGFPWTVQWPTQPLENEQ